MMELSCESIRYPEERRPKTSKYVELHVLHVPVDQWDVKLNKVPAEAIECFISAGFIRVYPDITLKTLRSELVALLGMDRRIDKFSFLKCVGRSLALVKDEQERDLKVKTFAPPYAPQPELYLLSVVEVDGTVSSQSLSQDTNRSSPEQHIYFPHKTCSLPTETKEPVKFPMIPHVSHCPPPTQPSPEEEADNSYRSTAEEEVDNVDWGCNQPRSSYQRHVSQVKGVNQTQVRPAAKGDTSIRKKQCYRQGRTARDSGVPESLEDRTSGFSLSLDRLRNSKVTQTLKISRNNKVLENSVMSSRSIQCSSPPRGSNVSPAMNKTAASPVIQTNGHHIFEEIRLVKEERAQLEWTRQELLRKGKDLLAQTRHRRNQARDSWKKKYFEAKKATAPLEYNLQNLRQELETFYNKLLHQLQARDCRRKQHQGRSNKNELIIQIMTQSHENDNLRRQVEDAKMKLVTEIKLRRQAATELRALKAELAQKKSQTSHSGPITSLSFGATTQPRLPLGQHPP